MIAARQIFLGRGGGAKLPYDAEVEYLESTGTQWIDTGVISSYDLDVEMEFVVPQFSGEQRIFGQSVADVYRFFYTSSSVGFSSGSEKKWSHAITQGDTISIRMTGKSFYVNGTYIGDATQGGTRGNYPCYLFAWNRSFILYGNMKLKYCTIKSISQNETLRDLMPVRIGTEGAMYDRVSKQLFRNQGTGAFLYGGDVYSVPVETSQYVQDGLVAMWDGKENAGVGKRCDTATSWVDLVGESDMSLSFGSMEFSENACVINGGLRTTLGNIATALNGKEITVEAVYVSTGRGYPIVAPNSSPALNIWNNSGLNMQFPIYGTNLGNIGWGVAVRDSSTPPLSHLVYAISETDGNCRGYLDGVLKNTIALPASLTTGYSTSQAFGVGFSSSSGLTFNGQMSALRIYSRALTAAEIAANYAVDKARFNLP